VEVSAVYGLEPDEGPDPRTPLSDHLRDVRRMVGFPARARIVAWGPHQSASATDPATRVSLAPLLEAGFQIEDVMSPPEALAALARQRPEVRGRDGSAWLAVNRHGVALAIVLDGELVYSREFAWNYRAAETTKQELLQRYTLVAHIAPELRHGFDVVRQRRGRTVDAVVTCGDLPDLRSLTMPLIDELDIEVETLDALDGLDVASALAERVGDKTPAMRLASAAGAGRREASGAFLGWRAKGAAAVLLVGVRSPLIRLRRSRRVRVSRRRHRRPPRLCRNRRHHRRGAARLTSATRRRRRRVVGCNRERADRSECRRQRRRRLDRSIVRLRSRRRRQRGLSLCLAPEGNENGPKGRARSSSHPALIARPERASP
jgi:hypothetical protein